MENTSIKYISYPNTAATATDLNLFDSDDGYSFRYIMKAGEMSGIAWIEVSKNGRKCAEIKESVCNLYF